VRVSRSCNDRRAVPTRGSVARHELVYGADVGQPFPLRVLPVPEALGPGDTAIERTDDERDLVSRQALGDGALVGGAQWRDAVNEVEFMGRDARAELSP